MSVHRVPGILLMPVCAGGGFDRDHERFAEVRQGYVTWSVEGTGAFVDRALRAVPETVEVNVWSLRNVELLR